MIIRVNRGQRIVGERRRDKAEGLAEFAGNWRDNQGWVPLAAALGRQCDCRLRFEASHN